MGRGPGQTLEGARFDRCGTNHLVVDPDNPDDGDAGLRLLLASFAIGTLRTRFLNVECLLLRQRKRHLRRYFSRDHPRARDTAR